MGNNLFIEGPIQTGKSTLIRQVLGDDLKYCGGFTSQRVFDSKGNTFGFRLISSDTNVISTQLSQVVDSSVVPASSLSHITVGSRDLTALGFFKYDRGDGTFHTDLSPFETIGIDGLKLKSNQKLLLIDEIGGVELADDRFRPVLFRVLQSDIPCLGVIKLRENMERIRTGTDEEQKNLYHYYDKLRQYVGSGENAQIMYFERDDIAFANMRKSPVARAIRDFISEI